MMKANDPKLRSWVECPEVPTFPFKISRLGFLKHDTSLPSLGWPLENLYLTWYIPPEHGFLDGLELPREYLIKKYLNDFFSMGRKKSWRGSRKGFRIAASRQYRTWKNAEAREMALIPMKETESIMPLRIPNYTDF